MLELGCARREEAVWRERLGQVLQLVSRALDASRRGRFVSLQVAWEGFIAQKCSLYGSIQREGWQVGRQAGCELREVAHRSLDLERSIRAKQRAATQHGQPAADHSIAARAERPVFWNKPGMGAAPESRRLERCSS